MSDAEASPMRKLGLLVVLALSASSFPLAQVNAVGFSSSNVEYIRTLPVDSGMPTGGRLVGKFFYVSGLRSLSIYDVSVPADPQLVSTTPIGVYFANEDVDTNGKVLLLSSDQVGGYLSVWDVRDKSSPKRLAELTDVPDHTFSCVLKCRWAYGASGTIVDLRRPAKPKRAGQWATIPSRGDGFDVTEVSPGLVLTSSRVIRLLDARKNPRLPKEIARGATPDGRLIHSNRWPRKAKDRFALVQGETPLTPSCHGDSGAFMTWDASRWKKTRTLTLIDEFRVPNGTLTDGNPPANAWGCTNMWFQEHPTFKNGGLVVSGFFEHGTRFLKVDARGRISQAGYFTPAAGSTIATYWINKEIVYSLDLYRGLDVLRYVRR